MAGEPSHCVSPRGPSGTRRTLAQEHYKIGVLKVLLCSTVTTALQFRPVIIDESWLHVSTHSYVVVSSVGHSRPP